LKRLPKAFSYALWAVVLFRLLCPVSLTSPVSLFSVVKPLELPGAAKTESVLVEYFDSVPKDRLQTTYPSSVIVGDKFFTYPITAPTPIEKTETFAFETVWLIGIAVGAVWGIVSSLRLRRRLIGSVEAGGRVRLADHIDTPFVFGLFRPKIYLPSDLNVEKQPHILRHEQYHIRRGDHVWRFLAYAALCIHWFNPLVWLAFYLSGKDMEMSCDEAVVRRMGADVRADYSASLLAFGTSLRAFSASPIAFGEGSTKGRIKNLLRWKNPALWLILVAIVLCAVVAVVCLVDPQSTGVFGYDYDVTEIVFDHGLFSSTYTSIATTPEYRVDESGVLWVKERKIFDHTIGGWQAVGELTPVVLTAENFTNGFGLLNWRDASVSAEGLLANSRRAWVVKTEGSGLSYYLLEQIDGKLYLACWYDRNDYDAVEGLGEGEVLVRWLFSVERVGEISGSAYNPNENIRYTPVKVVYLHPERDSPVWQDDAGNPFHLWEYQWNSDDQFFLRFISEWDGPQMWELVGRVEKATVDATLFANAFRSDTAFDPAELLAENRAAYAIPSRVRVETEEVFGNYLNYYLLEQANGEVYLVEWMDAPYYSPERVDDTMIVLTVTLLETTEMDEPITEYTEDGGHLAAQTTKFATSIGNGVLWDRSSGLFYGDAVYQWIDAPLEIGSEIRYTYTGVILQTSPGRISQILYAEKTLSPSAAIPIPVQLSAQASVAWEWANTMTLVLPEGILPETP
ncbi:MAG: hypothetical protein IKC99_04540, partial [Clostridia bacterium]|nr:hypothetical protein [Clostridia bacterium]